MANRREDDSAQEREDESVRNGVEPPVNEFLVGISTNEIVHVYRLNLAFTKKTALNLAVWIVALVDPECNEFKPQLDAVLNI